MVDEELDNLEKKKLLDEYFKHYRSTGIAFSATLITLSSALIFWAQANENISTIISKVVTTQTIMLSATILLSIFIQYFNYQGYKLFARSHTDQSTKTKSDSWFDKEDRAVNLALIFFLLGALLTSIIYFST